MPLHVRQVLVLGLLSACVDSTITGHGSVDDSIGDAELHGDAGQVPIFLPDAAVVADANGATQSDAGGHVRARDSAVMTPPADAASADPDGLAQHCVDTINMYRASLDLPPYQRAPEREQCVDSEAKADAMANKAHSAFGTCHESAQDECPGWPSKDMQKSVDDCLAAMWKEGPGADFSAHGHYINMSSKRYTHVACGLHDIGNGKFWATQDFY